jgi:imidazolonepropionase-like amidohydrolase
LCASLKRYIKVLFENEKTILIMKITQMTNCSTHLIRTFITVLVLSNITLALAEPLAAKSESVTLTGAHIFGHGLAALTIRNGYIETISDSAAINDPDAINLEGCFIVPAFIDSHVHLGFGYSAEQLIQGGIAAVVDLAAPLSYLARDYDPLTILFAGPMITAIHGYPTQSWGGDGYGLEISGIDSVRAAVDFLHASGAGVIKMPVGDTTGGGAISGMTENKSTLNDEQLKAIVDQAHLHGLKVAAHAITDSAAMRAAKAGADALAHTPTVALSDATVKAWSKRTLISTLAAFKTVPVAVDNLRRLREAGTTILYGTDLGYTTIPAINLEELQLLQKAGLDGDAILASVTEAPARYWGFDGFGSIRVGSRANLLILDADPRQDLSALTRPLNIYLNGIEQERKNTEEN